ncbi:SCO family protein [Sphingomonas japonica]|uniref:Protein SCO1/2 n=2 Tax=Sphingomonas japonica TaxID=511662 RepID=A0ABX0U077_9SPHN|nr:SCO family protein [Sphingomonas japonica]NIJ23955.1 protein SCO1/2 [Sphingomonas japonica]
MNQMNFALAGLLLLSACNGQPAQPAAEPPLAGASIGGPFVLTDQTGKTVRDTDFAGQYRIVYFGYTFCPDVCPVDVQNIGAGLKALERSDPAIAAKITPIFITVDPERDTVPVVGQFVAAFHPRMVGLTGSPQAIAKVAKEFAIFYEKRQAPGAAEYLVDHSRQAYLMDPDGKPLALLPADVGGVEVAAEIKRWVT